MNRLATYRLNQAVAAFDLYVASRIAALALLAAPLTGCTVAPARPACSDRCPSVSTTAARFTAHVQRHSVYLGVRHDW